MQIGEFDQRIKIQTYTVEKDSHGQDLPVWTTLSTVWARVQYARADEATQADQLAAISRVKFFIRYLSTVTEVMRIKWESEYYRILAIEEVGVQRFQAIRAEWKDSQWFDVLRDTGHGIRETSDTALRTTGKPVEGQI